MRINLIIATYSGYYERKHGKQWSSSLKLEYYLKVILAHLNNLKHNLTQITIVKPIVSQGHQTIPNYYNFNETNIDKIRDRIVIVEQENIGGSYSQFFNILNKYPDFDYHIFIEDDYLPFCNNFDSLLVEEYEKAKHNCAYLYLCAGGIKRNVAPNQSFKIADFSLGIIDKKSVNRIFEVEPYHNIMTNFNIHKQKSLNVFQIMHSSILRNTSIVIKDFCSTYFSIFFAGNNTKYYLLNFEYPHNSSLDSAYKTRDTKFCGPLFMPLQIFNQDVNIFEKTKKFILVDAQEIYQNMYNDVKILFNTIE